jgi:hypothetical protein
MVISNTASAVNDGWGGGLCLVDGSATLQNNTILGNAASWNPAAIGRGGGLYVQNGNPLTLTNNLVVSNHANTEGGGLWIRSSSGYLLHTTIADNVASGDSGQGVYVGTNTTLAFTNTIIAGHTGVGIAVTTGSTATLSATLWYANGVDTDGAGVIQTGTVNVYGDPAFTNPADWDYHLGPGSAAIDAGVDAGVPEDIDGDPRPQNNGYDIGADEFDGTFVYLPLVWRNAP